MLEKELICAIVITGAERMEEPAVPAESPQVERRGAALSSENGRRVQRIAAVRYPLLAAVAAMERASISATEDI